MDDPYNLRVVVPRYPWSGLFVPFAFVCFVLVLLTDLGYYRTANLMWLNFSTWLLLAGLIFGGIALVAGLIDLFLPRTRIFRPLLAQVIIFLLILAFSVLSSFVHAADGWTAIMPYGLGLSAGIVVLVVFSVFLGRSSARFSRPIGVNAHD
jgi:uncharacterized membrane protein